MIHASGFSWAAFGIVRARTEKEAPMNQMDYKQAPDMLHRAGFTTLEIDRLCRLRQECAAKETQWTRADLRRQEYVCRLVATGRLTDRII